MSPERDDYLDDDGGKEAREGRSGPLSAGWLRALIVLGGLAILLIVTVPYMIEWIAPSAPLPGPVTRAMPPGEPVKPEALATAPTEPVKPEPIAAPTPASPLAPAAPAAASDPRAEAPASEKPALPPRPEPEPKPAVATKRAAKEAAPAKAAAPPKTAVAKASIPATSAPAAAGTPTAATGGDYWIQVGLFARSDNAERLAKELREERFAVEIAQTTRGDSSAPVSQHEVLVTGSTVEAVTAALKGTGTAEATGAGVVVRPAMDLKDAVTLSRRLAGEGLQVRIRRVTTSTGGGTLYLVRVGGYPTRDAATAGKRELASKGVTGFLTQGPVK
ncbi:MAG TPA: SPOR domain-containing protein [Methylomirabilota bacterium]|nr:SPOR domain-containing protein [Methylomirabilota bacterium]